MSNPALPTVPMQRHKAVAWSASDRAALAVRLAPHGVSITELSDAREQLGLERLSSATPAARAAAHYLLMSSRGREALAEVRALRALYTAALLGLGAGLVAEARHRLGLRRSTPSCLRLGELRSIYAQARAMEIALEERIPMAKAA